MRSVKTLMTIGLILSLAIPPALAGYHHGGDTDSDVFRAVYPATAGTKLDNCAACHTGGRYEKYPGSGKWVTLGSCQWCHYSYGYDQSGNIDDTLNSYGRDFNIHGKDADALTNIENLDSDGDGFSNKDEILAIRYPGDETDDPTLVPAPYQVFDRAQMERWPGHEQLLLMNTHKSGDFYALYSGVTMGDLLDETGLLPSATGIRVYAPDGWSQYHPLEPGPEPLFYSVYGTYPSATFHYDETADVAISPDIGWCSYDSIGAQGLSHGDPIHVENGLRMLLAFKRNNEYLVPGELDPNNRLNGEGPFRVVPPQKLPGPPDQSVKSPHQDVIWPFDENADHNAGFATRSATIIKVDPLPDGFTDINTLEAGWNYVDENKIVVYGAIDPTFAIFDKFGDLLQVLNKMETIDFKKPGFKYKMILAAWISRHLVEYGWPKHALRVLEHRLLRRVDGCAQSDAPDNNDWITGCDSQKPVYWQLYELKALMDLLIKADQPEE